MEITILTPTYNRSDKLIDLFYSLKLQSNYRFKWLIIDDGSVDDTEDTISKLRESCDLFDICYFKKDNGGKHTAINYGLTKVNTEYCLIVDSDDILKTNAIDFFLNKWKSLDESIVAISCLTESQCGGIVGDTFPIDGIEISHIEQTYEMNVHGDKIECYRTRILQENQFPVFYNERFLTEAVVWNRIGTKYKKKCFNTSLMIHEYYEDGLTSNLERLHKNSPIGSFLYHFEISNLEGVSKNILYKHRCIAMKYLWYVFFQKKMWFFTSFSVGFFLMCRSFFNEKNIKEK